MKRKQQQQILYGLLALVIIFIIYKYMFKKTDNFSIGGQFGWKRILGCAGRAEPDPNDTVRRSECIGIAGPTARRRCRAAKACRWNEPLHGGGVGLDGGYCSFA